MNGSQSRGTAPSLRLHVLSDQEITCSIPTEGTVQDFIASAWRTAQARDGRTAETMQLVRVGADGSSERVDERLPLWQLEVHHSDNWCLAQASLSPAQLAHILKEASTGSLEARLSRYIKRLVADELLSEEECRRLLRVARDVLHPMHAELVHVFHAFSASPEEFVMEARDILLCKSMVQSYALPQAGRKGWRGTGGSSGAAANTSSIGYLTPSGPPSAFTFAKHYNSVVAGDNSGGSDDPVWVLVTLAMSFFFFVAAASHFLFLQAGSPMLAPVAYIFAGLLSLYDLFGASSVLGWDTNVQWLAERGRDVLLLTFSAMICLEAYEVFPLVADQYASSSLAQWMHSALGLGSAAAKCHGSGATSCAQPSPASPSQSAERVFWFWRDSVGFVMSMFWLLALRYQWRATLVAAVLVTFLGIYAAGVLASH